MISSSDLTSWIPKPCPDFIVNTVCQGEVVHSCSHGAQSSNGSNCHCHGVCACSALCWSLTCAPSAGKQVCCCSLGLLLETRLNPHISFLSELITVNKSTVLSAHHRWHELSSPLSTLSSTVDFVCRCTDYLWVMNTVM